MSKYIQSAGEHFNQAGFTEELTESNFIIPNEEDYLDFGEDTQEWDIAAERPGLWENIRKKKKKEGDKYKPAKPETQTDPTQTLGKRLRAMRRHRENSSMKTQKLEKFLLIKEKGSIEKKEELLSSEERLQNIRGVRYS